jgi:hypothetical protein
MKVELRANLQPIPKKWSKTEIVFLLKYYPLYKAGHHRYTASVLRGALQGRTMAAISKKYWSIMGGLHSKKPNVNQYLFDFACDKLK